MFIEVTRFSTMLLEKPSHTAGQIFSFLLQIPMLHYRVDRWQHIDAVV